MYGDRALRRVLSSPFNDKFSFQANGGSSSRRDQNLLKLQPSSRASLGSNSRESRSPSANQAETVKKAFAQPLIMSNPTKTRRLSIAGQKENIRALDMSSMQPPSFNHVLQSNRAYDSNRSIKKRPESPQTRQETPQKKNYLNLSTIALNEEIQSMNQRLQEKDKELIAEKQKCLNYQRVIKHYKNQLQIALNTAKEISIDIQQNPNLLFQKCSELCLAQEELKNQNRILEESMRHETLVSEEHRMRVQILKKTLEEQFIRENNAPFDKGGDQKDFLIEISELKLENESLSITLEESEDRCSELQVSLEKTQAKNSTLEKRIVVMAQKLETLQLENGNLSEEKARLLDYIDQMQQNKQIESPQNQTEVLKIRTNSLQLECVELLERTRLLEENNEALNDERESVMQIVRERELEINDNITRLNALKVEHLDLKREMNLNQENFTALTITLSETQDELDRTNKKNRELEKEITQLENYIEIMKLEGKRVENSKIEDLKQKIQTLLQM